jgi:hypothetical protein
VISALGWTRVDLHLQKPLHMYICYFISYRVCGRRLYRHDLGHACVLTLQA